MEVDGSIDLDQSDDSLAALLVGGGEDEVPVDDAHEGSTCSFLDGRAREEVGAGRDEFGASRSNQIEAED